MKRDIKISDLHLDIEVPASKSVLHRELIVTFLMMTREGRVDPSILKVDPHDNKDIIATKSCLLALLENGGEDIPMQCNESGSTLRFMMSVGMAYLKYKGIGKRLVFLPKGRLIERPLDQLIACLGLHGVKTVIDKNGGKIILSGSMTEGEFPIEGNVSSQYISGLLMSQILMDKSSVRLVGPLESKGYFELTVDTMRKKGIAVDEEEGTYKVTAGDLHVSSVLDAEGDWSSGAFLLSLAALCGSDMKLRGLDPSSKQKDKVITEILRGMGLDTSYEDGALKVIRNAGNRGDLVLDASDWPDIVPYVAVLAAAFTEKTRIRNVGRLRFKESDRVKATIEALESVGGRAEEDGDDLVVLGGFDKDINNEVVTYGDHRMAQTGCLLAAWTGKTVRIDNGECVDKSFPGLWELLEGGMR